MNDDIQRINKLLAEFPQKIYLATKKTEDLREEWLFAEAKKDYETAGAFLKAKAENLTEGQAKAKATEAVYETTMTVIGFESKFRRSVADQTRLENEFTSIRKQANLHEAMLSRMGGMAA